VFGLGKLLTLPYALPAAGIKYCVNKVIEMAEQEMTDETPIKEELILLNMRFEDGEIDEAEFRRLEAPLVAQFSAIRAYRKQLATEQLTGEQLGGVVQESSGQRVFVVDAPEVLEPPG